ncbi:MAG TPA: ParA family protein [Rickettsiales bacterium]|nr:ParA family protein [Rickettsiales bacterium]
MASKIISIVNQKGGVGKTTTVINLAAVLVALKKKVLVIDCDPQSNASSGFDLSLEEKEKHNVYNLFSHKAKASELICKTKIPLLDIIPCTIDLASAEVDLVQVKDREFELKNNIPDIIDLYDFILIDCPPSLGLLTVNALVASTTILIPLQCEFFALEGLSHLLDTANRIKENFNPKLNINGIILTMYDRRNKLTEQVEQDVRNCLGEMVYKTIIPRNIKLSESSSHGLPAILYDPNCQGSLAYMKLAEEILKRII